jgi:hypothetical protein
MKFKSIFVLVTLLSSINGFADSPRMVNIINFIRQVEPRPGRDQITPDALYETTHQEILQLNQYHLPGTFLLQYDALIDPRYQTLLKTELNADSEVGAWWEITQPHVEAAGLKWRGRYCWDWHANVGFSIGYTLQEREKLVDVYMEKFKSIFGKYPSSVGSWFIDEHTLEYMYEKYGIVASCTCRDQVGTDGYIMWGGYWNQAYYPSKKNSYMPAQTKAGQIPVPVFRMLGSDPIYQYDAGFGDNGQGVITLEPVSARAGGNPQWVKWFFKTMFEGPSMNYNYVQAGQENSFTWPVIKNGLSIQIPLLDSLRKEHKIRVETLSESGVWFKSNYPVTPATSVAALTDPRNEGRKTVWFNSRYYRANLLWKNDSLRFRDIHLFNENYESPYLNVPGTTPQCNYITLPVVDGFLWSTAHCLAGLRVMKVDARGKVSEIPMGNPVVEELGSNVLQVTCSSEAGKNFRIVFYEDRFEMSCETKDRNFSWVLELQTAPDAKLPFEKIGKSLITARQNHFDYSIGCKQGSFVAPQASSKFIFRIAPSKNKLVVEFLR